MSSSGTRERFDDARWASFYYANTYKGAMMSSSSREEQVRNRAQRTTSESHPYRFLGKDGRVDLGGPFDTVKVTKELDSYEVTGLSSGAPAGNYRWATGVLEPCIELRPFQSANWSTASSAFLTSSLSTAPDKLSVSTLNAFGAGAIDAVKPTNPTVDLAISLGEFVSERKFFALPGSAGSVPGEYLNYMFGIAPTLADIQDLRRAISEREEILAQYVRDSGRLIRRRYEPDPISTVVKTVKTGRGLLMSPGQVLSVYLAKLGTLTTVTKQTTKLWFAGAFTYHLPKEGIWRDIALLDRLYGVIPGSALLWELTPYSWLLDYKLSTGDVLSNLDSFSQDGLVMPYGYVMCTQETVQRFTWRGSVCINNAWVPRTVSGTVTSVTKQRLAANPFGFGVQPGDLTPRQLSIIAALGLTKL